MMDAAAQPLYDLSPLFWLLLVGVLTALGPLAWVWWRNRGASSGRRLQALTVLTLFLTFDLVLFGDFTSLHLAAQEGIDPGPVPILDDIKAALAD